jgi:8-oxo-dGTP pyrophosphatase MutT (NUDIX family)
MTRRAAILVPLWSEPGRGLSLLLIQRAAGGPHSGQVAFPGGRHDAAVDASLVATALRESEEEVGLGASDVDVLGALSERRTYSSEFVVSPFVARIPEGYAFHAQKREVAALLPVSVAVFREPRRRVSLFQEFRGRRFQVPGVDLGGSVVWGLTLDVIDELLASPLLAALAEPL